MIYRLCKSMVEKGMGTGLQDKVDVFFAMGRLTETEYTELCELITPKAVPKK